METNESLAYIAGFFDGEGCVMVSDSKGRCSTITIQFTNTNLDVLDYIANLLEGSRIYSQKRYGRKEIWRLVLSSSFAVDAIELLLPYLVVKKDVAKLALEFYRTCLYYRRVVVDEAELILRRSYAKRISDSNKSIQVYGK